MGFFERWIRSYNFFLQRHATWVLSVAVLLTFVSIYYSVLLYKNLRTDMEELLPTTARSVMDLHQVRDRLQSTQSLAVLVFSQDTQASRRFIVDLAREVSREMGSEIGRVEYRIDREIEFFRQKRPLFIDTKDLTRIRDFVRDRIEYEKELHNPLNIFRSEELREPSMDFGGLQKRYLDKVSAYTRFKDGFYANEDESVRVALIFLKGASSGISSAKRIVDGVERIVESLRPESYSPDLQVRYAGDVMNFVEEHESLIHDLIFSAVVVMFLVSASLLIYFRSLWMTSALTVSLLMGTFWTFAVAHFTVGYLNANSAFLGSIILGNGINYGIILMARYLEERRGGRSAEQASYLGILKTGTPTITAALAAGLAYGSLAFTQFRGFRQFGVIGLIGMVLCWVSAFTVLPALLAAIERFRPWKSGSHGNVELAFAGPFVFMVRRFPRAILLFSWLALFFSAVAAITFRGEIIETDTSKLRDRHSMEVGSGYLTKYLDEVFGRYISPLVILADTPEEMDRIADDIKAYRDQSGPAGFVSQVYSLHDFVPSDQKRRVRLLREIRSLLKPSILNRLGAEEKKLVREFLPEKDPVPFGVKDLPPIVQDRFRLRNGEIGNIVIVEPVLNPSALADGDNQFKLINALREAADRVRPGTPVVGTLPITVDMYQSVRRDGPRATAIAFLAVVVLVVLLFRRPSAVALVLFSLVLGVLWLLGVMFTFDLKINFLNFIALPITFGIGLDYGVNIVQRYRLEGRGGVIRALRGTGGAVVLASLTTVIGYASLLMAGNQAFFSFGRLAILGELTCLVAALLTLPAYLIYRDSRGKRSEVVRIGRRDEREFRRAG